MRQKVRRLEHPQFSADGGGVGVGGVRGASGKGHMAQPYVPIGSGSGQSRRHFPAVQLRQNLDSGVLS